MTLRLELPRWHDLHAHFRQGPMMAPLIKAHKAMGCAGILAMPNTRPPVERVSGKGAGWSVEGYRRVLDKAGAKAFESVIVPLYLTRRTTPKMIEAGAKSGLLKACKYYPPHGTTGAEHGAPLQTFIKNGVLKAMEDCGIILCVHGEEHGLPPELYFAWSDNAETIFYRERMPRLVESFPKLKIVAEHVTTRAAAEFVRDAGKNVGATVTPQHLIYTCGDLLKGLKYHLYCLPLVKFVADRAALREAVGAQGQRQFFAGTDSAPHAKKVTECGCAAGCFTGGIAPQLYAQGFEMAGVNLATARGEQTFKRFLCLNGPEFYGLNVSEKTFVLEKKPQQIKTIKSGTDRIVPLPLGMDKNARLQWRIAKV